MEEHQPLIPGLPDDIALDCIARVPHRFLHRLLLVSRRWRDQMMAPSFRRHRVRIGSAEDLIFVVQALSGGSVSISGKPAAQLPPPAYALSMYNATEGSWHHVESIPMFAQCVTAGGKLVLVGGWDPLTLNPVPDLRVVDLIAGGWRKGRPMGVARSFFACAAMGGKVYVAGGHDGMKNALRTAECYDVEADEWAEMGEMAEERDECRGVAIGGRFWAASGYGTERQGRFSDSVECYDPEIGEWRTKQVDVGEEEAESTAFFAGAEGRLWCAGRKGAREYRGGMGWVEAAPPPEGMKGAACAAVMDAGRVFVMGASASCGDAGEGYSGWILQMGGGKWAKVETPPGFSGFPYSAAAVRI